MIRVARPWAALLALCSTLLLAGCERPPIDSVQNGYRGTGMLVNYNPRTLAEQIPNNQPPESPGPPGADAGPRAKDVYKNVKVLGDLSIANFNRNMAAITQWVAPKEGCAYCHNIQNFAEDAKYTKVVARRMIQMTQHVNSEWKPHVAATGVTCFTCHRGNPVPANVWFAPDTHDRKANFIGDLAGQNIASKNVGFSSLPNDPFTAYLKGAMPIRVNSTTALPSGNRASIKQAEHTFGLMVHFSKSLGVNCTYCHNTSSLGSTWNNVPPQLATAWHGIRMARGLNNDYMEPLTANFPVDRLGPMADVAKVNCATCHQGAYKPLFGAQVAKDFPELWKSDKAGAATPALPPPVAEASRSVLYFDLDSPVLQAVQASGMSELIAELKARPAANATISGYHSAAGTLAHNQELAKQRAFTVRDTLLAAGIAEKRVVLAKPQQTSANVAGEDPSARRVEVTVR